MFKTKSLIFLSLLSSLCFVFSENAFNYCMTEPNTPGLKMCMGKAAISFLQSIDEQDNYTLFSDFVAAKDENLASRSIVNFLEQDPVDFRGIMEDAGVLLSQRSLQWHLDNIYPGLMFKIGPSADSNSVAEFVMDPKMDERFYAAAEPSTAKVLTKHYLLPMLLGLKFNIAVFIPIIFGLIVLLLKKSLFLVKAALYISSVIGIGGAASLGGLFGGAWPVAGPGFVGGPGQFQGQFQGYGGVPGKIGIVDNYQSDSDFLNHDADYSRKGRKVIFDKTREFITHSTPLPDRFYDYEKTSMHSERSAKMLNNKNDNIEYNGGGWNGWHAVS